MTDIFNHHPLDFLIEKKLISIGEELSFSFKHENHGYNFTGSVQKNGIQLEDKVYSVSFSAVKCLCSAGINHKINGFWAWKNSSGRRLGELYLSYLQPGKTFSPKLNFKSSYYHYPASRDVVFIFGAGASYADGAPLQRDILDMILINNGLQGTYAHRTCTEFLEDNFSWNQDTKTYPSLEQIFGFLDYFILKKESLNEKYNLRNLQLVKEAFIYTIYHVISSSTRGESLVYSKFWNHVYKNNTNISVITLNYDTYIDDAFYYLYPGNIYLDYCVDLENYEFYEAMDESNWWINPREPIISPEIAPPISIKLIKLHGSLNWKYCNCCNGVLLTPFDHEMIFYNGEPPWSPQGTFRDHACSFSKTCSRDGNKFETLLVPPSHLKDLTNPVCSSLFIEATNEIRKAKKVILVGYSLPDADVHIKAILKKSIQKDTEICVIDINEDPQFKMRYYELSRNVKFYPSAFKELLEDDALMSELLNET